MSDASGADYSRDTYEVTAGKRHHRTEKGEWVRLRKGDRFHPTQKQVADGSLENSARKVSEGTGKAATTVAADIGLRSLAWGSKSALKKALDAELTVEDFDGVEPGGETGYVTADVDAVIDARAPESDGGG